MKVKKSVTRSYLGGYLVLIFSGVLASMMSIKYSIYVLIALFALSGITLALLITSNVLLYKKRKLHPVFAMTTFSIITAITIAGTVFQTLNTINGTKYGESSVYGWIIFPIGLIILAFADYFIFKDAISQRSEDKQNDKNSKNLIHVDTSKEE